MLSPKEMREKAEIELDIFVSKLLEINGVTEYIGIEDDTYKHFKEEYIKQLYPIVEDVTFKLRRSEFWHKSGWEYEAPE